MKTIFWLAVVFAVLSGYVIIAQASEYKKLTEFERFFWKPHTWPYPVLLACIVVAFTV